MKLKGSSQKIMKESAKGKEKEKETDKEIEWLYRTLI